MSEKKSIKDVLIGTVQGLNNEGSSKRATIFWLVVIITTSLTAVYEYGYICAVQTPTPTEIHKIIIKDYKEIRWTDYILVLTLAGYGTIELITAIVRKFTGASIPEKAPAPTATTTTTTTATVTETETPPTT